MNEAEASIVLAHVQAFDRRTVGESDIRAWWRALDDVPLDDAVEAVIEHYRESRDWMMPADVRRGVTRLDAQRRGAQRAAEIQAERAREGLTEIDCAPPAGPTKAWDELGEELARRTGNVRIKSPSEAS
jgi:hypothetical protein